MTKEELELRGWIRALLLASVISFLAGAFASCVMQPVYN